MLKVSNKAKCSALSSIFKKVHQQVLVFSSDIFKITAVTRTRYRKLSCKELAASESKHVFSRNLKPFCTLHPTDALP